MGNCCGLESREDEGGYSMEPTTNTSTPKFNSSSPGYKLGNGSSPSSGDTTVCRETILKAAEERRLQALNRGVMGSGDLSKKLEEEKRQGHRPVSSVDNQNVNLVWD